MRVKNSQQLDSPKINLHHFVQLSFTLGKQFVLVGNIFCLRRNRLFKMRCFSKKSHELSILKKSAGKKNTNLNGGKKESKKLGKIPFGALDKKLTAERNALSPLLTLLNISSEGKKNIIENVRIFTTSRTLFAVFP